MKTIIAMILTLLLSSCVQRECQHDYVDTDGVQHTYYYKGNYLLTKASADSVEVVTPDETIIKINKPVQNNDSIKATAVIGGVPVVIESEANNER